MFGLLALTDALMVAWRGVNVLTGGSIIAASVLVPCMLGTIVLALLTLEFVTAFPRRPAMPARWRAAMLVWGAIGAAIAYTAAPPSNGSGSVSIPAEVVFYGPAMVLVFVLGAIALRRTQQRDARLVI